MGAILCLETSSRACSVAVGLDGNILSCCESEQENAHSSKLYTLIGVALSEAGLELSAIDAFAISKGPGSYTGLRIGVASAKGFCYSLDKPLLAVSTLKSLAYGMREKAQDEKSLLCPMLDARRMEVYTALFDMNLAEVSPVAAEIITESSFGSFLDSSKVIFAGEGATKCKSLLSHHDHAIFIDDMKLSARFLYPIALQRFNASLFEDLAYFEPFYLKDFIAGKPRVKGLR